MAEATTPSAARQGMFAKKFPGIFATVRPAARQGFQDLAWPAAAGNVAWSFFTILIAPPILTVGDPASLSERALVLLLLSAYLIGDWLRTHGEERPAFYWLFDGAHLIALTAFAIGAATGRTSMWLFWSLTALLLITALGHCLKAFGEPRRRRFLYAGANALGVPLAWWGQLDAFGLTPDGSQLPVAVLAVLIMWLVAQGLFPRQKASKPPETVRV